MCRFVAKGPVNGHQRNRRNDGKEDLNGANWAGNCVFRNADRLITEEVIRSELRFEPFVKCLAVKLDNELRLIFPWDTTLCRL